MVLFTHSGEVAIADGKKREKINFQSKKEGFGFKKSGWHGCC